MNLLIFLSDTSIFDRILLSIVLIVLPLRSIFRYFRKSRYQAGFFQIAFECLVLIFLFTATEVKSFELTSKDISVHWIDVGKLIGKICLCCIIVFIIDYASLKLQTRQRIGLATLSPEKLIPLNPKWSFFCDVKVNNLAIILICILTGAWEELVFRGYFYKIANSAGWNISLIVVLSSVFFSFNHASGGLRTILFSLIFGFFFFALYLMTNSLTSVIFAHIFGNLFTIFYALPYLRKRTKPVIFF